MLPRLTLVHVLCVGHQTKRDTILPLVSSPNFLSAIYKFFIKKVIVTQSNKITTKEDATMALTMKALKEVTGNGAVARSQEPTAATVREF